MTGLMHELNFPPVEERLANFLRREFQPAYDEDKVSSVRGDASFRRYFRYFSHSDESFILAAYPEPFNEENFTYRQVHDLFREVGLPVPRILAMDGELGIVLQEDLGDQLLQRKLSGVVSLRGKALLLSAIDLLVTVQLEATAALRPEHEASRLAFDEEKLDWELAFFRRHYLGSYRRQQGKTHSPSESALGEEFSRLVSELAAYSRVLCHRDYHVRNLMVQEEKLYIIDFQDARLGPPSYDLVSLLKDSIELSSEEIEEYTDYYLARARLSDSHPEFERQFHLMCIQRLLKALGTYGHQIAVRHNPIYAQYVDGSLRRVLLSLQTIPEFPYIRSIIEKELEE